LEILIEGLKNIWFEIEWLESLNCKLIFALKYDLLLGPYNGVSKRTQWLVENELEVVRPFSFRNIETLKVEILPK